MKLSRNKLYSVLFIACLAGYSWLYAHIPSSTTDSQAIEVCLIKRVSALPCPSCGATRSIISLLNGEFMAAITINPLGLVVATIMLLAPIWIVVDIIAKSNSLFIAYRKIEIYLKKPIYAFPLILLIVINWIWNVTKGL